MYRKSTTISYVLQTISKLMNRLICIERQLKFNAVHIKTVPLLFFNLSTKFQWLLFAETSAMCSIGKRFLTAHNISMFFRFLWHFFVKIICNGFLPQKQEIYSQRIGFQHPKSNGFHCKFNHNLIFYVKHFSI